MPELPEVSSFLVFQLAEVDGGNATRGVPTMRVGGQEMSKAPLSAEVQGCEGAPRSATPATVLNVDDAYTHNEQHPHFTGIVFIRLFPVCC